jgi:hypothetical protein
MIDLVYLKANWLGHIMANQFKIGVTEPVQDIALVPGKKIIQAEHVVPLGHELVNQVGTNKPGTARY